MSNFLFQIEKEEKKEYIEINTYSTDNKRNTIINKDILYYQILISKEEFQSLNFKNDKISLSDTFFYNKNGDKIVKIIVKNKELHDYITKELRDKQILTYEADLIPEHRYLIDGKNAIAKQIDNKVELKYLCLDIETVEKDTKQTIIMTSLYSPKDEEVRKVYVNKSEVNMDNILIKNKSKGFEIITAKDEKELLLKLKADIINFKPQLITGWNVIDFDFKVIKERMSLYDIDFRFSEFSGQTKLRINSDFFVDSTMICPGLLIFDAIHLLRTNFISFEDYKLNTVAKEVLKDEKVNLFEEDDEEDEEMISKMNKIKDMALNHPLKLIEYNYKDSVLVSQIIEKLSLLDIMIERSILTNTPLSKVKSPIASLDILYLQELHKQNIVAPTNFNFNSSSPIEGAYIIEPKQGFYSDIFVFDFKSLYPTIIMTFNIDPFTYCKDGSITAPNNAKFDKKEGILPQLISKLYKQRDIAKKNNDKVRSLALKTTMNSFYGALASTKSRFYEPEVSGAITAFARFIIKKTQEFIESLGHHVIYGDTDSIFVKFKNKEFKSLDDKKKFGFDIEKQITKHIEDWVKNEFGQENHIQIELEKIYSSFFIASKKRYVGFDEFTKKVQFVGMEAIRGDWTDLARGFQERLVNLVFQNKNKKEIGQFILDYVDKLNKGDFDSDLVYKKKITKPLSEYTKTTPPHVKAARELPEFTRRLVKYIMSETGPKHVSLIDKNTKYDYKHYIEKQLKGVSDDILSSLDIDFDEVLLKKSQKSLDKFF